MNEIRLQVDQSIAGLPVYAIIRNYTGGNVWQTTTLTFVPYVSGNLANYVIPLTNDGGGFYSGNFPSAITTPGVYTIAAYAQQGGSPVDGDPDAGVGQIAWNGTQESDLPTGGYTTLADVKTYLGRSDTTYDAFLTNLITAASAAVDRYCRSTFAPTTYNEYYDGRNNSELTLDHSPILSLTSVTLCPDSSNPEVITGDQYVVDANTGTIRAKQTTTNSRYFAAGFANVLVSYSAGYTTIPADVTLAVQMLVANIFYQSRRDMTLSSERMGDYQYALRTAYMGITAEIATLLSKYMNYHV